MSGHIQLNGREYFPNLGRHASFNGSAKENDDGTWSISVAADWTARVDNEHSFLPTRDLADHYSKWWSEVRRKAR